ncbi:hypothetical protein GOP47_0028755 [Adiantum capillus-veneris]|nr:hypothetical protein GOP47_0028755 [Adiantum capillus-veneris]
MSANSWTIHFADDDATVPPQVNILGRETVLPASASPPHPLFLSCLDIFWQDIHYNRRLLFYPPHPRVLPFRNGDDVLPASYLMQQLKSSLSLCLVHYFPWCGRLAKGANPPHRLCIDCNDAGVEFVEASIDMPLSLLAEDGFQMKRFFDQLCQQPDHKGDCLFSSPLLSIQATLFLDGGLAIGVAQSHVVADGQSLWDFMVSWGECSRGVPLSLPPVHDRVVVHDPSPEKATWAFDFQLREEDKAVEEDLTDAPDGVNGDANTGSENGKNGHNDNSSETKSSENGGKSPPKPDSSVQYMFTLSASAIKQLKSEAGESFTSFEVTCAHFWKRTSFARKSPPAELTYIYVPINCRSRISPPLPRAYFGNVIGVGTALSTAGKIRNESLRATSSRIHQGLAAVTEDVVEAFMNWLEIHDNRLMNASSADIPVMKGLNVASSPHFPAYKVDFGWGRPAAVRTVKVTGSGELVFFGGRPGSKLGDVEICTALPSDVLKRLLQDPEFLAKPPTSSLID